MIRNKFLKRDNFPIVRFLAAVIAMFLAFGGYAQEKAMVRPIRIDKNPRNVTVRTTDKGTKFFLIAIDNDKKIYDIDNVPEGKEVKRYLLIEKTYFPTTRWDSGDMIFDQDTLPFNKADGAWFSFHKDKDTLSKHAPLEAKLFVKRTWHRYADSIVEKYAGRKDGVYEKLKDSLFNPIDSLFISVGGLPSGKSVSFKLVVNDVELIEHESFNTDEKGLCLDESLKQHIMPSPFDGNLKVATNQAINRIQVIVDDHVPSFIKSVSLEVKKIVDQEAKPNIPPENENGKNWWIWIVLGVLVLAALCFFALRFFFKLKSKGKPRKKFSFALGKILTDNAYGEFIAKMEGCLEKPMNYKEDPDKRVVSFEVDDTSAKQFAQSIEKQQGFFYELKKCIEEAKPDSLPKLKKAAFNGEIKAAKSQLEEINAYVAQLMEPKDEPGREKHGVTNPSTPPRNLEELQKELDKYMRVFAELQRVLEVGNQKPTDLVEKVAELKRNKNNLQEEVESWKTQTNFTSPLGAKRGIDSLKDSITNLQEKNVALEVEKKDLEDIVNKVKKDPTLFKGQKEFKKLSDLVVDAEEGSKVREKMNNDPNEIEKDSPTGILVQKGRILDKFVKIADEVFKKKDSASKIEEIINNSPIAIQVRKGNFLDKAKDDVAMIRKDEQGWLGDCELKNFIEYIVNPEEILNSNRTKTGLYKLVNDIESHIGVFGGSRKKIDLESIQYNWLKQRIEMVIEGYDDYLHVEFVASKYGTPEFDTSGLKGDVKTVFDNAERYLKFGEYKNYWKNIAGFLFNTLDSLPVNDEIHNIRALMFYTSQFYSIASIMNEIYGDLSYSTVRPKLNASLFNVSASPVPTHYGFPILDDETLQKCKFEYKGASDEDAKVKYLKQYKPLPFIFLFSYFDDNTLA